MIGRGAFPDLVTVEFEGVLVAFFVRDDDGLSVKKCGVVKELVTYWDCTAVIECVSLLIFLGVQIEKGAQYYGA